MVDRTLGVKITIARRGNMTDDILKFIAHLGTAQVDVTLNGSSLTIDKDNFAELMVTLKEIEARLDIDAMEKVL